MLLLVRHYELVAFVLHLRRRIFAHDPKSDESHLFALSLFPCQSNPAANWNRGRRLAAGQGGRDPKSDESLSTVRIHHLGFSCRLVLTITGALTQGASTANKPSRS